MQSLEFTIPTVSCSFSGVFFFIDITPLTGYLMIKGHNVWYVIQLNVKLQIRYFFSDDCQIGNS